MKKQKKLTLQEYIQCHNVKRQICSRSKSKNKNKDPVHRSRSRSISKSQKKLLNADASYEDLNSSISDQMDFRMQEIAHELCEEINEIKLFGRQVVSLDKDFAQLSRLLDGLMTTFKKCLIHVHKENMLLFQMAHNSSQILQGDVSAEKLQKSLDSQSQQKLSPKKSYLALDRKTIKQKMRQTEESKIFVKKILKGEDSSSSVEQFQKMNKKGFLETIIELAAAKKRQNEQQQLLKQSEEFILGGLNFLNSSGKVSIDTDEIDRQFENNKQPRSPGIRLIGPKTSKKQQERIQITTIKTTENSRDPQVLRDIPKVQQAKRSSKKSKQERQQMIDRVRKAIRSKEKLRNGDRN